MTKAPHRRSQLTASVLLLLLTVLCAGKSAHAQATASKAADLSVFGGYTRSTPDYGSPHNNGGTVGVDYTRYFRWRVVPSFEVRGNYTTGPIITQESLLFGLRMKVDFRHIHPYGNALFGGTKIIFKLPPSPKYTEDSAITTSLGGGVDIDLVSNFQAKIDFQNEFKNFGPNGTQPHNADFTLAPTYWTVGVVYRIPFRDRGFASR